jgi:hypothetical protein
VRLFAQQADPVDQNKNNQPDVFQTEAVAVFLLPSFMILAPAVGGQVVLALEPFRALDAVVFTQSGQILVGFRRLVLGEMLGGLEVGADLVVVSVRWRIDVSRLNWIA